MMTADGIRRRLSKLENARALANCYYTAEFSDLETRVQSCLWVRVLPSGRSVSVEVPDELSPEEWQREADRMMLTSSDR